MKRLGITVENLDHIATYETERFNQRAVHPVQTLAVPVSPEDQKEARTSRKCSGQSAVYWCFSPLQREFTYKDLGVCRGL